MGLPLPIEVRELLWPLLNGYFRAARSITIDDLCALEKVTICGTSTGYNDLTLIDLMSIVVSRLAESANYNFLLLTNVNTSVTSIACLPDLSPFFDVLNSLTIPE